MVDPDFAGLIWAVAFLSAAAGALALALSTSALIRQRSVSERLSALVDSHQVRDNALDILFEWLEWLGRKLFRESNASREIRENLAKAGYFGPTSLFIFLALRLSVALIVCFLVIVWRGGSSVDVFLGAALGVLTYRSALILVKLQGERRARRIQRELPSVLDIILMVLDSGVSIDQCLHYVTTVVGQSAPTTSAVLVKHLADVDSGVPYDVALDRLGQRLAVDEGVDFASLLKQAIFHGGELGPSLRRFSVELADRRLARAREEGGRRATYLTIVMVFFFVPVLLVLLLGPAVVDVGNTLKSVATRSQGVHVK
jgi:tight adherence protein C